MKRIIFVLIAFSLMASDALIRREEWKFSKTKTGYDFRLVKIVKRLGWKGKDFMRRFEMALPGEYSLTVEKAYTVNSMGKKIDVPPQDISTGPAPGLAFFPYFSFLKLHRIDFGNPDLPSESYIEISGKTQEENLDWSFTLLEPFPALEKRWIFTGFDSVKYYAPGFVPQEFLQPDERGGEAMAIRFVNLPPYPPEPLQPPPPSLVISSWSGWTSLANSIKDSIEVGKGQFKFSDIFSALEFLRGKLRRVSLPIKWSLLYARSPEEVLKSGYASPVEVALVLKWVLAGAGYEPEFYLEAPADRFSEEAPALSQFTEAGIYLPGPGLYINSRLVPEKMPPQRVLWIFSKIPHLLRTGPVKPGENGIRAEMSISGGKIKGRIEGLGNFLFYGDPSKEAKKYAGSLGLKITVNQAKLTGNILEFEGNLVAEDGLISLRPDMGLLPASEEGFGEDRITPVKFPQPFFVALNLRVENPSDIIFLPSPARYSNDYGRFILEVKKNSDYVRLNYRMELLKEKIAPAEAGKIKKLIHLCRDKNLTSLVFLPR